MAVTVDTIESVLKARVSQYIKDMEAAEKAFDNWYNKASKPAPAIDAGKGAASARAVNARIEADDAKTQNAIKREAAKTAEAKKRLLDKEESDARRTASRKADAEEKAAQRGRTADQRKAEAQERAAKRESDAVERAARKKAEAEERSARKAEETARRKVAAEEAAQARISAVIDRTTRRNEIVQSNALGGRGGSRSTATRQTALMSGTSLGRAPAPVEDAVNYFERDRIDTQARYNAARASGDRAASAALRDQLTTYQLIQRYRRAGLSEVDATARAEERVADIARRRADREREAAAASRTDAGRRAGAFGVAARVAAPLIGAYGGYRGAQEYLELTDAYKQLNAQLRLATAENGNLAQAQTDVERIARETRVGLGDTAQLYATFQRNAAQLGISQSDAARATETISKSFQISGATAQEAAGGLRQFLQALQSGVLRGEEFNSVVENAPRLAKLLADQLTQGNIGALRELAQQGKITGEELRRALTDQKFADQIDREFKELPVTFDQAMTLVRNAAITTFGAFDQGGEFSKALSNFITGGTDGFAGLAQSAEQLGIDIRSDFEGLRDAFQPLLSGALSAFGQINTEAQKSGEYVRQALATIDEFRNAPGDLVRNLGSRTGLDRFAAGRAFLGAPDASQRSNLAGNFAAGRAAAQTRLQVAADERRLTAMFGNFAQNRGVRDVFNRSLLASTSPRAVAAAATGGGGGGGRSAAAAAREAERDAREALRRERRFEDDIRSADDRLLSARLRNATTEEERERIQRDQIQREFEAEQIQLGRMAIDKDITETQRQELETRANSLRLLQLAEIEIDKRQRAERQADARMGALADVREAQLNTELEMANSNKERVRIERELIRSRYDELEASQQRIIDSKITTDAEKELARIRLDQLAAERAGANVGLDRRYEGPRAQFARQLGGDINESLEQVEVDGLSALNDGLTEVITNFKSLGDVFKNVANQIIADLVRIAVQQAIIAPLLGATGGGIGSVIGSIFGGGRATGGPVTRGRMYRVNEHGTEGYASFSQPGRIIPLGEMNARSTSSNITVQQTVQVDARNSVNPTGFEQRILALSGQQARVAGETAYKQAVKAAPGAVSRSNRYGVS
jgi:tape measure domain-containing protein